jgi:5-(carboxyamino)imidazole ribonucleotide mutase
MKAVIFFGSGSDKKVFEQLKEEMNSKKLEFQLRILSAHKCPKELEKALQESKADLFICGAGLSAALPGVVASLSIKPVIGIPCKGAYDGLDALLSVHQMPPDVSVIGVGIEKTINAVNLAEKYLNKKLNELILVKGKTEWEKTLQEKAKNYLIELKIPFTEKELNEIKENSVNLVFKEINSLQELNEIKETLLIVPVINKCSSEEVKTVMNASKNHYWVGLNNYKNGALAAIELVNSTGKYDEALKNARIKAKEKVLKADEEFS